MPGFVENKGKRLEPIIKWPGGKEKELKYILPNKPVIIKRFFEPFVGGGSVFMAINAQEYFVNDLSTELYGLYCCIKDGSEDFFSLSNDIDKTWSKIKSFFELHSNKMAQMYFDYRDNIENEKLWCAIKNFTREYKEQLVKCLAIRNAENEVLISEIESTMFRKMQRMLMLEKDKGRMPLTDVYDNLETILKGSLYMYYRNIYNKQKDIIDCEKIVLFFFLRNYAYSGMFRYNAEGDFNVPYGGIAYNSKSLSKKLKLYESEEVKTRFAKTTIENLDFEVFLNKYDLNENDFVFLDPPYDTEFSTYAQNEFGKNDQQRLANYLINECPAKWMLVIKNTDFIFNLYANHNGINIGAFDKEYTVSFMNRNDKKVTHLMIKNYV